MSFKWGAFVAELVNFLAVALVVYVLASKLSKMFDAKK
jgi:large-conductance mechanosensitive channel